MPKIKLTHRADFWHSSHCANKWPSQYGLNTQISVFNHTQNWQWNLHDHQRSVNVSNFLFLVLLLRTKKSIWFFVHLFSFLQFFNEAFNLFFSFPLTLIVQSTMTGQNPLRAKRFKMARVSFLFFWNVLGFYYGFRRILWTAWF